MDIIHLAESRQFSVEQNSAPVRYLALIIIIIIIIADFYGAFRCEDTEVLETLRWIIYYIMLMPLALPGQTVRWRHFVLVLPASIPSLVCEHSIL